LVLDVMQVLVGQTEFIGWEMK